MECWDPLELTSFLNTIADIFPEQIRLIRSTDGEVASVYVTLPFFRQSAELLPQDIHRLLELSLGMSDYRNQTQREAAEVDSYLMVLGCIDSHNSQFTMVDLQVSMALDQWNIVKYGSRQLHIGR